VRRPALTLVAWGAVPVLGAVLATLVFGLPALPTLLLAGAGAACAAVGLWSAATGRDASERPGEDRAVVELSLPTFVATLGATGVLVALAAAGQGLLWPAAAVTLVGLAGLVRERVR
jgi:hypothetical protein